MKLLLLPRRPIALPRPLLAHLLSSMAAPPPPPPTDSEDNPDDSLCSALDGCSLSHRQSPVRPLGGESRVERAWAHWRRLGSPKLVVAPMVDNSELPFRMLCRKYGAEAAYTPMLHSRIFTENEKYRRMEFTTCKEDRPLLAQFCANDPDTLLEAARIVEPYCDYVDINLGYAMAGQLTMKSDVYSVGIVRLELLTGRKPVDHNAKRAAKFSHLDEFLLPELANS